MTTDIYAEIRDERMRQDAQWGGAMHDDQHSNADWRLYRGHFELAASAALAGRGLPSLRLARIALVKVAALAVAEIEALDRVVARIERIPKTVPPSQSR